MFIDDNDDDDNCSTDEDLDDDDDDDIYVEREQIFGLDHSLYEYHKALNTNKSGRNNPIVHERFTGW